MSGASEGGQGGLGEIGAVPLISKESVSGRQDECRSTARHTLKGYQLVGSLTSLRAENGRRGPRFDSIRSDI